MTCRYCLRDSGNDIRMGCCFQCANAGELRAARRTVLQHLRQAVHNLSNLRFEDAWFEVVWAWQRVTLTGDYKRGGYFEQEHGTKIWEQSQ